MDYAATTPVLPEVVEAMMPYFTFEFGNPGSLHEYGRSAREAVEEARGNVAGFLNCDPGQVVFTSGGSEGNNLVIAGIAKTLLARGKPGVAVSAIEHESTLKAAMQLSLRPHFMFCLIPSGEGGDVRPDAVSKKLSNHGEIGLVSVMTANNETGVENDIPSIAKRCRDAGILFHTDAVQAAGIVDLDTKKRFSDVDFMTISSHKINGPKGVGALYVKDRDLLSPLICGGSVQEYGLRGGTENVPGIVGFGEACRITAANREKYAKKTMAAKNEFLDHLKSFAGQSKVMFHMNGDADKNTGKTISLCFPGIDAETLLILLNSKDVFLSAGSACTSLENTPSHVLKAMGLSDEDARSTIRVSFSHITMPYEIKDAARIIVESVCALKGLSAAS